MGKLKTLEKCTYYVLKVGEAGWWPRSRWEFPPHTQGQPAVGPKVIIIITIMIIVVVVVVIIIYHHKLYFFGANDDNGEEEDPDIQELAPGQEILVKV